jgi:hypothetical protein
LRSAGFVDVDEHDVTPDYLATARRKLEESELGGFEWSSHYLQMEVTGGGVFASVSGGLGSVGHSVDQPNAPLPRSTRTCGHLACCLVINRHLLAPPEAQVASRVAETWR